MTKYFNSVTTLSCPLHVNVHKITLVTAKNSLHQYTLYWQKCCGTQCICSWLFYFQYLSNFIDSKVGSRFLSVVSNCEARTVIGIKKSGRPKSRNTDARTADMQRWLQTSYNKPLFVAQAVISYEELLTFVYNWNTFTRLRCTASLLFRATWASSSRTWSNPRTSSCRSSWVHWRSIRWFCSCVVGWTCERSDWSTTGKSFLMRILLPVVSYKEKRRAQEGVKMNNKSCKTKFWRSVKIHVRTFPADLLQTDSGTQRHIQSDIAGRVYL